MTARELMEELRKYAEARGWDLDWEYKHGDGVRESAEYTIYLDNQEAVPLYGR